LGVFGLEDQMVLEPPRQPGETRDLSFSAIFELSAPHHEEEARLEMRETTSLLLAVDLEHREGGHGEGCSLEPQVRSPAPNALYIPVPRLEVAG
jgi:hypothetical protein